VREQNTEPLTRQSLGVPSSCEALLVMAILVKDFTWKQTEDRVVVRVPLKGVPPNQVDICTMDFYLKARSNFHIFRF